MEQVHRLQVGTCVETIENIDGSRHPLYSVVIAAFWAMVFLRPVCAETPIGSESIADSVGINVHLHYTDAPYANFPLVQDLLKDLHVRHIRDGLVDTTWDEFYKRHNRSW